MHEKLRSVEKLLAIFKRKIMRRVVGAVKEYDTWRRRRINCELYEFYKEPVVVKCVKINTLLLFG